MKAIKIICIMLSLLLMASACGKGEDVIVEVESGGEAAYTQITQEEAMSMMESDSTLVIVDVRTQEEYKEGHIPGAICIPNETIGTKSPSELPDQEQVILVYCRSGRRSKEAAGKLADMGYTNVYEFGGIVDWTGEIVTDETE